MSAAADGDTSSMTTSACGSSSTARTRRPVSIRPPWATMSAASASAIACDPPSATSQPLAWPDTISIAPTALVSGRSSRWNV
jgi:hypothetical protein